MKRIIIFGNSGSGKSTLAHSYASNHGLAHLDLDTIAWIPEKPGVRQDLAVSENLLLKFTTDNNEWVIEGCYSSLIQLTLATATELVFLNPGTSACQANCRNRPWETHKYESKEAQDKNLSMLLEWVSQYEDRDDEFSLSAHRELFDSFKGQKVELRSNEAAQLKANDSA